MEFMKINLTIGTIWQDQRNQKHFELSAINQETGKIQLSSVDNEQAFSCMTENSLHKNYKLIALSLGEFRPSIVTTISADSELINEQRTAILNEENQKEVVKVAKKAVKKVEKSESSRSIHKVELKNGDIVSGLYFLENIAGVIKSDTWKTHAPIWYLTNNANGKALLNQWEAKIVTK
jgi:glucan-binding YG repeat protein